MTRSGQRSEPRNENSKDPQFFTGNICQVITLELTSVAITTDVPMDFCMNPFLVQRHDHRDKKQSRVMRNSDWFTEILLVQTIASGLIAAALY